MNQVVELLQDVDLASYGRVVVSLLDDQYTDPIFIGVILGILILLGSKMASPFPKLRSWGLRVAVAAFLIHLGYTWYSHGINSQSLGWTLLRSANVAGFVLAPLWLILPIVLFVYTRMRLALAAFLIYAGYACIAAGAIDPQQLPRIAIEAVIASGLMLVVAWILQPITDFVVKNLLPQPKAKTTDAVTTVDPSWLLPAGPSEADETWRLRQAAAELLRLKKTQLKQETEGHAEKNRRRQRARLKAELCYSLNEPSLVGVFPRAMFDDFMARYLGDRQDPEAIEENAKELESMIHQFVNSQPIAVQPVDLTDLTDGCVEEQKRIRHDDADHSQKRTKLAGLTRRYTQLAEKLIEEEVN